MAVSGEIIGIRFTVKTIERLCHILRDRRMRRGAVDFDFPELKVKLDEQGRPIEIVKRNMSTMVGIVSGALDVLNKYGVSIEHLPSGIDSFNVVVNKKDVEHNLYDCAVAGIDLHPWDAPSKKRSLYLKIILAHCFTRFS